MTRVPWEVRVGRRDLVRWGAAAAGAGVILGSGACAPRRDAGPATTPTRRAVPAAAGRRPLLAYFSRAGENYYYGDRIDL